MNTKEAQSILESWYYAQQEFGDNQIKDLNNALILAAAFNASDDHVETILTNFSYYIPESTLFNTFRAAASQGHLSILKKLFDRLHKQLHQSQQATFLLADLLCCATPTNIYL